jgi:hypothetical protein
MAGRLNSIRVNSKAEDADFSQLLQNNLRACGVSLLLLYNTKYGRPPLRVFERHGATAAHQNLKKGGG